MCVCSTEFNTCINALSADRVQYIFNALSAEFNACINALSAEFNTCINALSAEFNICINALSAEFIVYITVPF